MLGRQQQRMLKEGLLAIYREIPEALNYTVYYLPIEDKPLDQIATTVRIMQGMNHIPWPDEDCIICSEDHLSVILGAEFPMMIFMIRSKALNERYRGVPMAEDVDGLEVCHVMIAAPHKGNVICMHQSQLTLLHLKDITIMDPVASANRRIAEMRDDKRLNFREDHLNRFRDFMTQCIDVQSRQAWTAEIMGDKHHHKMGLATDVLGCLSNIVTPCHYMLRSVFKDGFGPPSMRRLTRDKPIFSMISYNRLYRQMQDQLPPDFHLSPHFRRGHLRYHWMLSGINRFSLPRDPDTRTRFALMNRVKRSYVGPTWIGKDQFEDDGARHQIVTGEIELH